MADSNADANAAAAPGDADHSEAAPAPTPAVEAANEAAAACGESGPAGPAHGDGEHSTGAPAAEADAPAETSSSAEAAVSTDDLGSGAEAGAEGGAAGDDADVAACAQPVKPDLTPEEWEAAVKEALARKEDGNDCFKHGDYINAIEHYGEAINVCPATDSEIAPCYANRAACYLKLEDYENCIEDCSQALAVRPEYSKALLRRALSYEKTDRLEDALADYQAVLKLEPDDDRSRAAVQRLPKQIEEQREKLKNEMLGKLKDLGNMCLKPFGLSTDNFQMVQDPNTGSYSINFNRG